MADTDGLPAPQRYLSISVVWIGLVMSVLDGSIANLALPTLAHQLDATASQSIWVINAYALGMVMLLLPLAACGEILGYGRIYLAGMAAFTLASGICIFAPTMTVLCLGRALQGAGAAGMMSMNAALLRTVYPARLLGRGLGTNAFCIGVSAAAAPTVASAILSVASWRWLFAVNIPFCIAGLGVGLRYLPKGNRAPRPFDMTSAVLSAILFGALVFGADLVSRRDNVWLGAGLLILSAVCAVAVMRRGWNQTAPLFPIDLLRIPVFGLSLATSTLSFGAQLIAGVSLPFLFQLGLGRTVVQTGLLMTPMPIGTALASMAAGRLSERLPGTLLNLIGLGAMSASLFLLATMPAGVDTLGIVWRTALCGAGFGFFQAPNNRIIVLAAPRARSGATGGSLSTARTTGQSLSAVLISVLFLWLPLVQASHWALVAAGVMALLAAGVSSLRIGREVIHEAADRDATAIAE
jgi:DHA2 family multidrug resistance protein-like MFS transporter